MPRKPTRAERFCSIRDAIMPFYHAKRFRPIPSHPEWPVASVLNCGPFRIVNSELTGVPNLDIWPAGKTDGQGGHKVMNVAWDGDDIDIASFKSGPWEEELLTLLKHMSEPEADLRAEHCGCGQQPPVRLTPS